jgi:hypothetical protein
MPINMIITDHSVCKHSNYDNAFMNGAKPKLAGGTSLWSEVVVIGFHTVQYRVQNNPLHAEASMYLGCSIDSAHRIEVVIPELNMRNNSVGVQGFMSSDRSSKPWYDTLLVAI